jgi:CDP-diacylglycerol--serine O-phosphatidyltransferase
MIVRVASPADCLHPSNILTYASLLAGISAIIAALHGDAAGAGALVAAAAIADTLDGRFARMFSRTPEMEAFGTELDSLCDAATFAVAPVVCAGVLPHVDRHGLLEVFWWAAAFAYVGCAVTRLGFYNVSRRATTGFVGLPVPAAALLWCSALLAGASAALSGAVFVVSGAAMVSPVRIPRPSGLGLAAFVMWPAGLIIGHIMWR